MGFCTKNKAKAPAKRAAPATIDAQEPQLLASLVPEEKPVEARGDEHQEEGQVMPTPRSGVDRKEQSEEGCQDDAGRELPPQGLGTAGVHGNPPPARYDSTATSCAGMTDADALSRGGTLLKSEQQQCLSPPQEADEESIGAPHGAAAKQEAKASSPASPEMEQQQMEGASQYLEPNAEEKKRPKESHASNFASRMQETFTSVKQSFSRSYQSFRSGNLGESLRQSYSGESTDMHPAEKCICGVLNDITEFGEKAMPCVLGEHADAGTEETRPLPLQIAMLVDTPGGPYVRYIPDELVCDAIEMGFITEEEVHRQKEEWERKYGLIPIEYTPAASFNRQEMIA
ncbi:uncharacterized protein LOC34622430 [Cyclospora cayetanensis]|uniref:Uncharacterized protein LOC34622430 n=1 Tax=Cyclospora cayetanensis TaxID=88456 RepID=A0A6P6S1V2_9EIME|nr:uncharacterized protein LOC34622430 [Cyclospora cayetanensis]